MAQVFWNPTSSFEAMKARAEMYADIRSFFYQKGLLEVETPLLSYSTATDPYLTSFSLSISEKQQDYYLQTSPEFPMKRLLAAHQQAIFQICKTFRKGEVGKRHNPEFTMLEWYQPKYSLKELLHETIELIDMICGPMRVEQFTYREAFLEFVGVDPFKVEERELRSQVFQMTGYEGSKLGRFDCLDLLLSHIIEPKLGVGVAEVEGERGKTLTVLKDYPSEQASLAQIKTDQYGNRVAERFEIYIDGLEIANAYHELIDPLEQRARFDADNEERKQFGLTQIPIDENLLAAMEAGLPACSGIALGLDRLLMVKLGAENIDEVLTFPIDRA